MNKMYVCALSLVAAMLPAQAAIQTYSWSYTGFAWAIGWHPGSDIISGTFAADDANGDAIFTQPELRSFVYAGRDYAMCPEQGPSSCTFRDFTYTPGQALTFRLSSYETIGASTYSELVEAGHFWITEAMYPEGAPHINHRLWTDETQFSISPIPEPETYWLTSLALLAAWGILRRRDPERLGKSCRQPPHARRPG